jgi:hypothetical protein
LYFNNKVLPFPDTQQMIYDTGEDLKNKIKDVLKNNNLSQ